jgi:DNA-binding CsgD family transcriptional regulator
LESDLAVNKASAEEQQRPTEYVQYGGAAILAAWFLLIFSGEVWGLEYAKAAEAVVQLSLLSIGGCFITITLLNAIAQRSEIMLWSSRLPVLLTGLLLCAGTTAVALSPSFPPVFSVASVVTGCSGAFFVCSSVRQLSTLTNRMILVMGATIFLIGIFIYAFVLYAPEFLRVPILCVLPLCAAPFYLFGNIRQPSMAFVAYKGEAVSWRSPIGWRSVAMLSVFCLFSCVIRGYLPYYMDNVDFSYIRSFSIILMFFVMTTAIICGSLLLQRFKLSLLYKWTLLSGVVFFALVPVFGLDNPSILALTDAYRGLCALLSLVFFASMARQLPIFGFRLVGGGLVCYIAAGLIGWLLGAVLFYLNTASEILRVISSVQCVLVLLAYILFFRQEEFEGFLDKRQDHVSKTSKAEKFVEDNQDNHAETEHEPMGGRWRSHCEYLAKEYNLTDRETEVFFLLAKGYKAPNISDSLTISYNTTRNHISKIYQKCGIHNQQEFVVFVNTRFTLQP